MRLACHRELAAAAALAGVLAGRSGGAAVRGPFTLEPVRALAARATAVAAIVSTTAGPEVLLLARDGVRDPMTVVARWSQERRAGSPDGRRVQKQRSRSDIDDTLWLYDLDDADRDSRLMEDLLDLEGLDDGERPARASSSERRRNDQQPIPHALAAAAAEMWMATSRGVWRLDGQGAAARWRPCGLAGHDIAQIAVAREDSGRSVVTAVAGGTQWRSTDLGQTWQPEDVGAFSVARAPALPADITATAVTGDEIWIGTAHGLFAADVEDDLDTWRAVGLFHDTVTGELSLIDGGCESTAGPRPAWFRYVPHVAVEVGTRLRAGRMEVRGLILLTVPLAGALP